MAEACVVIPVLLMLFLGLWQQSLAQMAQTRVELAARHMAWARAALGKDETAAKDCAAMFFPRGTMLETEQEDTPFYTGYGNNLTGLCSGLFAIKGGRMGQYKATVAATVPALPVAAPKPAGEYGAESGTWDFLSAVKTQAATVVWDNSEEQAEDYIIPLLGFTISRPELLVELGARIAISEAYRLLKKALAKALGSMGDGFSPPEYNLPADFLTKRIGMSITLFDDLYKLGQKFLFQKLGW